MEKKHMDRLELVEVDSLLFADYYSKQVIEGRHGILSSSMNKFGCFVPIVVNRHPDRMNIVVDGVQRVKEARQRGIKKMLVFFIDVPEQEEREKAALLSINISALTQQEHFRQVSKLMKEFLDFERKTSSLLDKAFSDVDLHKMPQTENPKKRIVRLPLRTLHDVKLELEELNEKRGLPKARWAEDYLELVRAITEPDLKGDKRHDMSEVDEPKEEYSNEGLGAEEEEEL